MNNRVVINRLLTGVPGLDNLLGGGVPEFSFNIIAGEPGSGKTTLAHQLMFALAQPDCRALYFTVLGEPALKMLRYQQQFSFFDGTKINASLRFVNLSADLAVGNFERVLARIVEEVKKYSPGLVFVDSFRSVVQAVGGDAAEGSMQLQNFVQQLAMQMTSWQATTFLIGEYLLAESDSSPIFTVADGILWLSQSARSDAMVRKIRMVKIRGQAQVPGWHTFRISADGIQIFPRAILGPVTTGGEASVASVEGIRLTMGNPELDNMLGGGLPAGYSLLVVGPSGSGKTILATAFLAEGVRLGQPGVIAAFEKSPSQLLSGKLNALVKGGKVGVIDTRSLGLSIDEILSDMIEMIQRLQAKRVVIDSLSGFELALAPEFSEGFRSSLYRMISVLTGMGVTILMTSELEDRYTDLRFSPFGNAFLADAIVMQRYIEIAGELKRIIAVVKVRASAHSTALRLFHITERGIVIAEPLSQYEGILSDRPISRVKMVQSAPGVSREEE
ncbi:MAG TPA: ATPase domain-containing protein [Spongiibacteraceae bacterium]|nr:ATPase domain-containing protein [Spongiibacteraceae bacterium]